jgi:uncharacterized membrane protein
MRNSYLICIEVLCVVGPALLTVWGLVMLLRGYLDVSRGKAILFLGLSVLAGVGALLIRYQQGEISTPMRRWSNSSDIEMLAAVFAGLLTALTLVFLIHLHSKWVAGRLSDAEKSPGLDGIRAWLRADNLVCVILISLLAWLSFDYSPFAVALLGLLALVAYPVVKSASVPPLSPPLSESNAGERQRVLNMLDSGKITASEGAELLSALSLSEKPLVSKSAAAPPQKLALIGALLLLIGFFLPWFIINPQTELERAAQKLPIDPGWTQHFPWGMSLTTDPIRFVGGDIQHGLGWLILFLGMAAAALPYIAGNLDAQTRQRAILAGLGVGAVMLLYLMTKNLRFVSVGILLAAVGYGLQLACALQSGRFSSHAAN